MNQNIITRRKDTICSSCGCVERWFVHALRSDERDRMLCTSCVLLSNRGSFCPTCFGVHKSISGDTLICCGRCRSYSHATCFTTNGSPSGAPSMCLSCMNPKRLILALREVKSKRGNGNRVPVDKNAAILVLTAAKIVMLLMSKTSEAHESFANMQVKEVLLVKKKAEDAVHHLIEYEERENKRHNIVCKRNKNDALSLFDSSSDSEEDSSKTLSNSGRFEGAAAMEIDFNDDYSSEDATF